MKDFCKSEQGNKLFSMATWIPFQFCSNMIIANVVMVLRSSWCQPYKSTSLSDHTTFLLKASVKWQNNLYSPHSIWIVQIRLFGNTEEEKTSSVSSVPSYLKHHNTQIPLKKSSPT